MSQVIIYPNDIGGVAVIIPAPEWLAEEGNTMALLAQKVVPEGKPFKIIAASEIPSDRIFRDAWEYAE